MNEKVKSFLIKCGMHYDSIDIGKEVDQFIEEMRNGLEQKESSLEMIPTYLTVTEACYSNRKAMVIDAGGTNLRVGTVSFDEVGVATISDFKKREMLGIKETLSKQVFFEELTQYTKESARTNDAIGFCFSYPAVVGEDKDAVLLRWSKEVKAPEVIGEKIGQNLVQGLKELDGKDRSVVLLNDTVATLLGGKGITPHRTFDSYIGFILGTGTNVCYVEAVEKIKKINYNEEKTMIINVESGGYNRLPRGSVDKIYDETTANPGSYQFEKMVSGRYLGPVALELLKEAAREGIFSEACNQNLLTLGQCELIDLNTFMCNPHDTKNCIVQVVETEEDRMLIYEIIDALIERAAKYCAIKLSSIVVKTDKGKSPACPVAIVAEGTTFFKLKDYKEKLDYYMKQYLVKEKGRSYEFISGENLNLFGTAIAALS